MEHNNLARSDRETLDTYCKMFELDWRADVDLFVTLLDKFEIGIQLPLFLESVLQAAYFDLTHCVVVKNLRELKYEIIECKSTMLVTIYFHSWN